MSTLPIVTFRSLKCNNQFGLEKSFILLNFETRLKSNQNVISTILKFVWASLEHCRIPYFDAWVSDCLKKEDTVLRLARDDQVENSFFLLHKINLLASIPHIKSIFCVKYTLCV